MKKTFCLLMTLILLVAALPAFAAGYAKLGQPFQDFTVTDIDGETFTLSKALETHEAVFINLFATWCPPCEMEFPFMQQAYEEYSDRVAVIVISVELSDTVQTLRDYRKNHNLTLPMAPSEDYWMGNYAQASSIPVSMIIDRFGNLALRHVGALSDVDSFRRMFDAFLGEDYTKTKTYQGIPASALSMEFPSGEALSQALNIEGGSLAFTSDPARRDYPFLPAERGGRMGVSPSNMDKAQTVASLRAAVTAKAGDALAFDVDCDLALGTNMLNVELDGVQVKQFMGRQENRGWAIALSEGEHEISFVYDQWQPQQTGAPFLSRVRLLSGQEAEEALSALPKYPAFDTADIAVENGVKGYFLYMGQPALDGIMVDGDTADIVLTVPADFDPEAVLFLDASLADGVLPLSSLLTPDGTGYRYQMRLRSEDGEDQFALAGLESYQPQLSLRTIVMRGEKGVRQVVDHYAQNGYAITWVPEETEAPETEATYTVRVEDEDGSPVPGAYLKFCTDDNCQMVQADENGVAAFVGEPAVYHVQILKLPEGYSFDPAFEAYTELHTSEMTVTVKKN